MGFPSALAETKQECTGLPGLLNLDQQTAGQILGFLLYLEIHFFSYKTGMFLG